MSYSFTYVTILLFFLTATFCSAHQGGSCSKTAAGSCSSCSASAGGGKHEHRSHAHSHSHSYSHSHGHAHSHDHAPVICETATLSLVCLVRAISTRATTLGSLATKDLSTANAALLWSGISGMLSALLVGFLPISSTGEFSRLLQPFAAAALLADCALHLIPSTISAGELGGYWLLTGIFLMWVFDVFTQRVSGGHAHSHFHANHSGAAVLNLVADAVHNFTDGLAIGAAFSVSRSVGISTSIAVLAHELPQEAADFAILLRAGWNKYWAILANAACAGIALLGTLTALSIEKFAGESIRTALLPVAGGALLYLGLAAIIPQVVRDISHEDSGKQVSLPKFIARFLSSIIAAAFGVAVVSGVELLHDH